MQEASCERTGLPVCFTRVALGSFPSRLYFGDEALDRLFQGFKPRQIVYLYGSEECLRLAEILCIRAQLPISKGGINSKVIFLDGGCSFNPSVLVRLSRQNGLDKTVVLRNIMLSRAFTCFQLTNFVETKLEKTLEDTGSRLVVISDFPALYCDQDLEQDIGREQFCRALLGLATIVKSRDAIALITDSREESAQTAMSLKPLLKRRCNITAKIAMRGSATRVILEKHPSVPFHRVDIPAVTDTGLTSFLEAGSKWEERSPHTEQP